MYPVLFTIPGINLDLPGYGFAMMVAFLLAIYWATDRCVRSGGNPDVILNCGFLALLCGVGGARAMYVIHYWKDFAAHESIPAILWAIVDVRRGGLEVYGGLIATIVGTLAYLFFWGHSVRWYLDMIAPSAAVGMAIGRIGCFLNGCCWGGLAPDLPWAVQFPHGSPAQTQQWSDRLPGAALPAELLIQAQFGNGATAAPLPREVLRISADRLDAACAALTASRATTSELERSLAAAKDPDERRRIESDLRAAQRDAGTLKLSPQEHMACDAMAKFHLTGNDIHRLAHAHPSLPVHPTQLYATVALGTLAIALSMLYWRRTRDGQVIAALLVVEPLTRWTLEVLRADNPIDSAGMTVSQLIAVCLSASGVVWLLVLQGMSPRSPRALLWTPEPAAAPAAT